MELKLLNDIKMFSGIIGFSLGVGVMYFLPQFMPKWVIYSVLILGFINVLFGFKAIEQTEKMMFELYDIKEKKVIKK